MDPQTGGGPTQQLALVGRTSELGEVERFLAPGSPARALVLCGDPGIGKITVWEAAPRAI